MKAVILAGGEGKRGRPFTEFIPKSMIPCNNRPIIHYIVKHISYFRFIDEIIIITDLKGTGGQIQNYLKDINYKKNVTFIQDSRSGTAGDLLHILNLNIKTSFLLWFSDNLCAIDLKKMLSRFNEKKSLICIATRDRRNERTGFAAVKDGYVEKFKEKPIVKLQMEECLGIYFISTDILNLIKNTTKRHISLSFDVLQKLTTKYKISTFNIGNVMWVDIESPSIVEYHRNLVSKIIKSMEH